MKFIQEGKADPDFLATLDKTSNIVICVPPTEGEFIKSVDAPDVFEMSLPRDLNLSSNVTTTLATSVFVAKFEPKIKFSFPIGIKLQIDNVINDNDIFLKIYKSFNIHRAYINDILNHHLIDDIRFILYVDMFRLRETGQQMLLKAGMPVINFNFGWYVQTAYAMPNIEEIYLISDNQIYNDFKNIF